MWPLLFGVRGPLKCRPPASTESGWRDLARQHQQLHSSKDSCPGKRSRWPGTVPELSCLGLSVPCGPETPMTHMSSVENRTARSIAYMTVSLRSRDPSLTSLGKSGAFIPHLVMATEHPDEHVLRLADLSKPQPPSCPAAPCQASVLSVLPMGQRPMYPALLPGSREGLRSRWPLQLLGPSQVLSFRLHGLRSGYSKELNQLGTKLKKAARADVEAAPLPDPDLLNLQGQGGTIGGPSPFVRPSSGSGHTAAVGRRVQ